MDKFANVISDMTIRLRDSRIMGVLTAGDANGFPLFHFHGSGSSRLETLLYRNSFETHRLLERYLWSFRI